MTRSRAFTGVQVPGVLDDLYADALASTPLGASVTGLDPTMRALGADRAVGVARGLGVGATGDPTRHPGRVRRGRRHVERRRPVASATSTAGRSRSTRRRPGKIETNSVTDPYSVALTTNSARSVVVDLDDDVAARPSSGRRRPRPIVERPVDRAIYELHVRDFSIGDESVPAEERGTYRAFTRDSAGTAQLRAARRGGHQHRAPAADVRHRHDRGEPRRPGDPGVRPRVVRSGVRPSSRRASSRSATSTASTGATTRSTSRRPRAPTRWTRTAARASASSARWSARCTRTGLQVVLDEVYNHTAASGQGEKSVLDRIVPGYYQRLNAVGQRRDLDVLPERRDRARGRREAHGRLRGAVGQGVQGRRLPLRPHGPPLEGEHARGARGARRAHARGGRRRRQGRVPLRRGLELRRGREQRPLRAGHAGPARRHRHRHVQRPAARRRARRQPGRRRVDVRAGLRHRPRAPTRTATRSTARPSRRSPTSGTRPTS